MYDKTNLCDLYDELYIYTKLSVTVDYILNDTTDEFRKHDQVKSINKYGFKTTFVSLNLLHSLPMTVSQKFLDNCTWNFLFWVYLYSFKILLFPPEKFSFYFSHRKMLYKRHGKFNRWFDFLHSCSITFVKEVFLLETGNSFSGKFLLFGLKSQMFTLDTRFMGNAKVPVWRFIDWTLVSNIFVLLHDKMELLVDIQWGNSLCEQFSNYQSLFLYV